jgi:hypothetical protein
VDVDRLKVDRIVKTLPFPDGVCPSPSGAFVGVASNAGGAVQVFRVSDWRLVTTLEAGEGAGSCLWLAGKPA